MTRVKRLKIEGDKNISKMKKTIKLKIDTSKWRETSKCYQKTVLLFITWKCNLNCSYCFNKYNLSKDLDMSMDYIKEIVEANPQVNKYDIQWGEPLSSPKINDIIRYLNKKDKKVSIYTNWYLLKNLDKDHENVRICISFQSLVSKNKEFKPITDLKENLLEYQSIYPIKTIYLINKYNYSELNNFVKYIEENFVKIKKITIWLIRDEWDYWSDKSVYVLPFEEYAKYIQNLLDNYQWKLNFDIFTKWVLRSDGLPKSQENQICRFKNVFKDWEYIPCLYLIAKDKKLKLPDNKEIPYHNFKKCARTWKWNCLADKIYLKNTKNDEN